MTQQERNQGFLELRGYRRDAQARTSKYIVMVRADRPYKYFLGRNGATRRGTTVANSVPARLKLEQGAADLVALGL